jgi:hypothetical protein
MRTDRGEQLRASLAQHHGHRRAGAPAKRSEHGIPTVGVCVAGATPPADIPAPEIIEPT